MGGQPRTVVVGVVAGTALLIGVAPASAQPSGDFNGDGFDDLVAGVPYEDRTLADVGVVHVIPGSSTGNTASGSQYWHEDAANVEGVSEGDELYGYGWAAGDFDGDGRDDLAIGLPSQDRGDVDDVGAVNVLYGSVSGLAANRDQVWTQASSGVPGAAEQFDIFGDTVVAADFNGDGRDDLAIGVRGEAVGEKGGAGAVNVLYGSSSGLVSAGSQIWHQDSAGIDSVANSSEQFGEGLVAGDFDGDGRVDLAIGAPGVTFGTASYGGGVNVLYSSAAGLTNSDQYWDQDTSGVEDVYEGTDEFGAALVSADFNGDGRDDLVIGVPGENRASIFELGEGAVNVLYGSVSRLTASGDQFFNQDSGIGGQGTEEGDGFGFALGAGDFNGDGWDDLAIGVPGEDLGHGEDAGGAHVLYGRNGPLFGGVQFWTQDSPDVPGSAEDDDLFGSSIVTGDFNGDGRDDLGIGARGEDVGEVDLAGGLIVLPGAGFAITADGSRFWHQDSAGITDSSQEGDRFSCCR